MSLARPVIDAARISALARCNCSAPSRWPSAWAIANGFKWYRSSALNYDPKFNLKHSLDPLDLYVKHTSKFINPIFRRLLPLLEPTRNDKPYRSSPTTRTSGRKANPEPITFGQRHSESGAPARPWHKHRPTYCTRVFRYFAIKDEDGSVRAVHINSRLIDGFREISVRTELSTRVLRPQLSLVRPCIQDFVASYRSHFGLTPTQRYSPMKPRCRWRTPSAEQDPTI